MSLNILRMTFPEQLTLCPAWITILLRYILFSTSTDSPSAPLYLQKFFNNRFRPFSITEEKTKMAHAPAKCSFAGVADITCGSSRGKDNFFLLNKCVVQVKNHLRSSNFSRTKVTEYDLILARAGKFNRSHE